MEQPIAAPDLFHEVTTLFPAMDAETFALLVEGIRQRGLIEPIWRYQGQSIDGVYRYRACRQVGIEPTYQEWDGVGSLLEFVVSRNLARRHLTTSQKAMIAVSLEQRLAVEAHHRRLANLKRGQGLPDGPKSDHREEGRSAFLAGRKVGVGKSAVLEAKKVVAQAPELQAAVLSGALTLSDARTLACLPAEQRVELVGQLTSGEVRNAREAQAQAAPEEQNRHRDSRSVSRTANGSLSVSGANRIVWEFFVCQSLFPEVSFVSRPGKELVSFSLAILG